MSQSLDFRSSSPPPSRAEFDVFARDYDAALAKGLVLSGEDKEFFARGRVDWLAGCLEARGEHPRSLIEFGVGTGDSTPLFFDRLGISSFVGLDISPDSLAIARQRHGSARASFELVESYRAQDPSDLVFSNGVFHHIPPDERPAAVRRIQSWLRPGGLFSFWENNAWHPGARWVMHRIPFDRDAMPVSPRRASRLLRSEGFQILSIDFLFVFPRVLRSLRPAERWLSKLPLGAQYQILCRRR